MHRQMPNILKLPARLVDELDGHDIPSETPNQHSKVSSRKDSRKADRVQKKAQRSGLPSLRRRRNSGSDQRTVVNKRLNSGDYPPCLSPTQEAILQEEKEPKSILKRATLPKVLTTEAIGTTLAAPRLDRLPSSIVSKLKEDDAEIAALEKKLGIKGKRKLPQAFRDDGLDGLTDGLDENFGGDLHRAGNDQVTSDWLAKKRLHSTFRLDFGKRVRGEERLNMEGEEVISDNPSHDRSVFGGEGEILHKPSHGNAMGLDDSFERFGSESDENLTNTRPPRIRENPYVAPGSTGDQISSKYVPSIRQPPSHSDASIQLRRQTQGLINRLTEANLLSIVAGIEKLYRENARQDVTSTLVDILLIPICDSTILPSTLVILSAGFITAVYKVIGTDFGAQVIERIVKLFDEHYEKATQAIKKRPVVPALDNSKKTSNLIALLAELYNFHVVGSLLIFDYIRMFLKSLSELNTELLLRIIQISGLQLRQDDPSSLKDIVTILRPAIADIEEQNLSARAKFMIESINNLKNNRVKTGAAASSVNSEHTVRMKKTIGTLNNRSIKSSEPLRISLRDIRESDKGGKWWLVGSSWTGNALSSEMNESQELLPQYAHKHGSMSAENVSLDLIQLAREQGMNTDVRKAIFVTIISASDHHDAYIRLMKLKLKKVQELEIPKVIVHCSSAEKYYNPYYTLISGRLCSDRKLRMAFQFILWDLFKGLGESNDNGDAEENNYDEGFFDTRQLVNLAKMFGALITKDGIGLNVLKNLNLRYLRPKTKMFIEVLLVTLLLHTQPQPENGRDEQAVIHVFSKVKDTPSIIRGLQHFLKKVVIKTDIAGGEAELATVRWACKVAVRVLDSLLTVDTRKA